MGSRGHLGVSGTARVDYCHSNVSWCGGGGYCSVTVCLLLSWALPIHLPVTHRINDGKAVLVKQMLINKK